MNLAENLNTVIHLSALSAFSSLFPSFTLIFHSSLTVQGAGRAGQFLQSAEPMPFIEPSVGTITGTMVHFSPLHKNMDFSFFSFFFFWSYCSISYNLNYCTLYVSGLPIMILVPKCHKGTLKPWKGGGGGDKTHKS